MEELKELKELEKKVSELEGQVPTQIFEELKLEVSVLKLQKQRIEESTIPFCRPTLQALPDA